MTAETIKEVIVFLIQVIMILFFIWLLAIIIKKELVKLKKKRLIREFKELKKKQLSYETDTYMKMWYFSVWFIQMGDLRESLNRIKVEYKELK